MTNRQWWKLREKNYLYAIEVVTKELIKLLEEYERLKTRHRHSRLKREGRKH